MPIWAPAFFGSGAGGASGYVIQDAVWFDGTGGSDVLQRTPSGAGTSNKKFVLAGWMKCLTDTPENYTLVGNTGGGDATLLLWGNDTGSWRLRWTNAIATVFQTVDLSRDPTAWLHWCLAVDTTQSTDTNRVKFYLNGTEVNNYGSTSYPAQDATSLWNGTTTQEIHQAGGPPMYLAQLVNLDGQSIVGGDVAITDLVGTDDNGVPIPVDVSGLTFGTNGWLLDFAVAPGTGNGAGTDVSGNNNHFTDTSMTAAQQVTDTCTDDANNNIGNYWTLNPLQSNNTLTGGNLAFTGPTNYSNYSTAPALPMTGKWYWEIKAVGSAPITSSANWDTYVGVLRTDVAIPSGSQNSNANLWVWGNMAKDGSGANGQKHNNSSVSFVPAVNFGNNSIMMIAVDMDNSKIYFGNDGTWAGSADPAAGSNPAFTSSDSSFGSHQVMPYQTLYADSATYNFGATAFAHTPPTGFKALNTANLPAPTVTNPSDFFNTVLYTANNSDGHEISTVGFVPDFVWIKDRDTAASHVVFDIVRGVSPSSNNYLTVNTTDTENQGSFTNTMVRLGKAANGSTVINGFTLDDDSNDQRVNYDGAMVAWCWKAGGAASSNTDGNVTGGSSVSVASHNGFAIVTYGDCGGAAKTIGHGMGKAPDMIIVMCRNASRNRRVYHKDLTSDYVLYLDTDEAQASEAASFGTIGTSTFGVDGGSGTSANGETHVAYCFARTPGLIGVGSYVGNGSPDGPYIVIDDGASGFRPAWVMIKRIGSTGNWAIRDAARNPNNPVNLELYANGTDADYTEDPGLDFIANGFKLRDTAGAINASDTYIYLAFAEHPFGGDGVAQAKAR